MSGVDQIIYEFNTLLKRGKLAKSSDLARQTVELLRNVVGKSKWENAQELISLIRTIGRRLESTQPGDSAVGNMVRRILRLVREAQTECIRTSEKGAQLETSASLTSMMLPLEHLHNMETPFKALKTRVMQSISDLLDEIDDSSTDIAMQASEHIHAGEVIMTMGSSTTVEKFLAEAAENRSFHVIIAESSPAYNGQRMAKSLAAYNVEITVIPDAAIYTMMSRVNKVIIGTNAVLADGGLLGQIGTHPMCLAAKHFNVPVLVCAAMFKLCPRYLCGYDQDAFNRLVNPTAVIPYSEGDLAEAKTLYPLYDYIPPDLITLHIFNLGGSAPSYVYRLLSEYYHENDYEL